MTHNNTRFCGIHSNQIDETTLGRTALGAFLGNALIPGAGGIIAGATLGLLFGQSSMERIMKKRVFVSFDFDNDKRLKDFIIAQSRNQDSPFEIIDHSLKEAAPERDWKTKARSAILRSEIVLVMVGPDTHKAPGVLEEVKMARELGKQIVQIIGYKDGDYTAVPNAGRLYRWNWVNLKSLLS